MATYEEEFRRHGPMFRRLSLLALLGKKIEVRSGKNFIKEGPNIIVGNHCGSYKDVAVLYRIIPRPIFFTANKMIFSRKEFDFLIRKHLQRHLKDLGLALNTLAKPLKYLFARYAATTMAEVGAIPVDLYASKKEAVRMCQEYLRNGRAIITLQGRGRIFPHNPHPYISPFKRGASIMAYNLYHDNGISVPVTALAIFGTHIPLVVPGKIRVNVSEPMFIKDYLAGTFEDTIENFRSALEARAKGLFLELIRG